MDGELFKLNGPYKSGTGWKFWARYEVPTGERDETGQPLTKSKQKTKTFNVKGKRDAEKLAAAWVAELNENARREALGPARTVASTWTPT